MSVKLLTEHHLEFLSLKGGCTSSSESTLVKMPHCWKSDARAHLLLLVGFLPERFAKKVSVQFQPCNRTFRIRKYSPLW